MQIMIMYDNFHDDANDALYILKRLIIINILVTCVCICVCV